MKPDSFATLLIDPHFSLLDDHRDKKEMAFFQLFRVENGKMVLIQEQVCKPQGGPYSQAIMAGLVPGQYFLALARSLKSDDPIYGGRVLVGFYNKDTEDFPHGPLMPGPRSSIEVKPNMEPIRFELSRESYLIEALERRLRRS